MSRLPFLALVLLAAGCGGAGDRSAGESVAVPEAPEDGAVAVQTETLTGLYQAGDAAEASRMCIVEGRGGQARFGLVVATPSGSCSGTGRATGRAGQLALEMAGDSACRVVAGIDDGRVVFPPTVPGGCAYYCAPGATMAGALLDKTGGTSGDALRARDLVGDPLCADLGG